MSCGGRIYKGDSIAISIPFDVSGYTDLVVDYYTTGDTKIEKTEEELTIEDGFITAYFDGHDLDLLPDGVIRYTITYQVDGEDAVDSTNTPLYLKTPAGYSAQTIDEIVEGVFDSGYTSGRTDGYTDGYQSGFVAGVDDTRGRMATTAITANGVYERADGFNRVEVDVPLDTPCNIDEGKEIDMDDYSPYFSTTVVPDSGYAGLSYVTVNASSVYDRGVDDVRNQFVTLSATTNGLYLPQSEFAVFKEVLVNVPVDNFEAKQYTMQSGMNYSNVIIYPSAGYSAMSQVIVNADAAVDYGKYLQKNQLVTTAITKNGTYSRVDGFKQVTVDVPQPSLDKTVVCIYQGSITIPQDIQFSASDPTQSRFFDYDYAYVFIGSKSEMDKCYDNDFLPAGTYALKLHIEAFIRGGVMSPVYVPIKQGTCTVTFDNIEVTS